MFSNVLQPPVISLFSSTGSDPLQLWSLNLDSTLPHGSSAAAIQLLHDSAHYYDSSKSPPHAPNSTSLIEPPTLVELGGALPNFRTTEADSEEPSGSGATGATTGAGIMNRGYELYQTVLHIQSPKLPKTYIQCPPGSLLPGEIFAAAAVAPSLGLKHPWMHLHVRNLGREWSFEVGIVDVAGRIGVVRMSTFQKRPKLKLKQTGHEGYPLLHLPLTFPSRSSRPLTAWTTINLHLPTFIPYFSHLDLQPFDIQGDHHHHAHQTHSASSQSWESSSNTGSSKANNNMIPYGSFSHVAFVRVYATCRLRRIWFDDGNGPDQAHPWEFDLFSAD